VSTVRHKLGERVLKAINRLSGALLPGFAVFQLSTLSHRRAPQARGIHASFRALLHQGAIATRGRTPYLVGLSVAVTAVHAQTSPATPAPTPKPAENAVNPGAIQALKDMGVYLQSLKRFHVSTGLTGEVVLADGQKLQHTATADLDVQRPNKLRARMFSARSERAIFYAASPQPFPCPRRSNPRRSTSAATWASWSAGSKIATA